MGLTKSAASSALLSRPRRTVTSAASSSLLSRPRRTVTSAASSSLLSLLRAPTNDVYLIGTAHVSAASERAVRSVIQAVRPGAVMVELCDDRARAMRQNARGPSLMDALGLALPFLSGHPHLKPALELLDGLVSANGRDMRAALEEADATSARIVHGDLPQAVTLSKLKRCFGDGGGSGVMELMQRAARAPPPPEILVRLQSSLMRGAVMDSVEELKDRAAVRALRDYIEELAPDPVRVVCHDRDAHMDGVLARIACEGERGSGVVAVVGVAHMDGIERKWVERFGPGSARSIPAP